jgi:hypothetical protein
MADRGDRGSWLTRARKSSFARLAASASARVLGPTQRGPQLDLGHRRRREVA